jgi:hypothetical protein
MIKIETKSNHDMPDSVFKTADLPIKRASRYQGPGQLIIENNASLFTIPSKFYENLPPETYEIKEIVKILKIQELLIT